MNSYLERYAREIAPRFKAMDVWLKSGEEISVAGAANLLDISEDDIIALRSGDAGHISQDEFISLLARGSSVVCGLYRREMERNSPITYTATDIAYIYDIDSRIVREAFDKLNASEVSEYMLIKVLAEISVDNFKEQ